MKATGRVSNPDADRYAHELSDRQRFVLDLIAAGRTNPEIAERLGITLNGAKWNVSEILTKLGFDSREEAAAYWRDHQRWPSRARRFLALLPTAPLWKPVLGVSVACAATLGVWLGVSAWTEPAARVPIEFYMDATVFQRREGNGFQLEPKATVPTTEVEWWYQDDGHFRQQFVNNSASGFDHELVVVADGNTVTYPIDGQYFQYSLECEEIDSHRLFNGMFLGLLPDASVDDLVRRINEQGGSFQMHAAVAGQDTVLGYQTTIVEYGPTWIVRGTSGGVGRIWVEPQHMVALRNTTQGNDGSEASRGEATKVVFDGSSVNSTFDSTLPKGQAADAYDCVPPG